MCKPSATRWQTNASARRVTNVTRSPTGACRDALSAHNLLYWSAGDYLGFGAGAHGHLDGRRWWTVKLPREFISAVARGACTEEGAEVLDHEQRGPEALMLGLRLASGIDVGAFNARFGDGCLSDRAGVISDIVGAGLLEQSGSHLRLAPGATMVANEVICRLL